MQNKAFLFALVMLGTLAVGFLAHFSPASVDLLTGEGTLAGIAIMVLAFAFGATSRIRYDGVVGWGAPALEMFWKVVFVAALFLISFQTFTPILTTAGFVLFFFLGMFLPTWWESLAWWEDERSGQRSVQYGD
ncbi:MAG: hypothetical protein HYT93_05205 [Parcubacteria group bacterium]|nr:hypothetical protein [Parcubacteria group bacterium]